MGCTCNSKPQAPAPIVVNAGQTAAQQATFNKEAALQQRALNMVNQVAPEGSITYAPSGTETEGIPGMTVTKTLSPEQQKLYDTSTRLAQSYGDIGEAQLGKVRSSLENPFSLAALGAAPTANEATRTAARDAIIARMQPQMDRDRAALETKLINQGFVSGSEAFNAAMDQANRARNDFYLGADVQAGNEMARMYGLETNKRDRAINEMLMERNQPMSELAAFVAGSQPTGPTFVPTPQGQIAAPDFGGMAFGSANMANQAAQNEYNQKMAAYNASNAGLYGLGGTALGMGMYKWGG